MPSVFQTISRIVYGFGAVDLLPEEVKRFGEPRVLIITDRGLVANGMHKPVEDALKKADIPVNVWGDVVLDPTPESIEDCVAAIGEFNATVLIGLGGGSAMDSTKAAALRACHPGPIAKYFGMHKVPGPCMPTIMIPTTAGTGSEMTSISVIADAVSNSKIGIVSDHLYARTVLLDPALTLSLPPRYTAYTGLDAFVHAMESYVNLSATPFTEGPDLHAMLMISGNLRQAYTNGRNPQAREAMLYASSICGMGFSNTQNGVIHAIGMAVPATYHLPHGLLMAACAPMGIAFNCHAAPEKYRAGPQGIRREGGGYPRHRRAGRRFGPAHGQQPAPGHGGSVGSSDSGTFLEHFHFENALGVERSETPPRRRSSRNSLAAYSSGATYSSADRLPHS